jgi:hypothetical protein
MAGRHKEIEKGLVKKETKPEHIGNRFDGHFTWTEVAEQLSRQEGKRLSRAAAQQSGQLLMKRLKQTLLQDPVIQDWLYEQGFDVEQELKEIE